MQGNAWKWRSEIAQHCLSRIPMDLAEDDGGREGGGGVKGDERNPRVTPRHGSRVPPHH